MPVGVESGQGHALPVDAQSLPRLHARLPLLLRATLSDAVLARPRRRVLVAHLREAQLSRGAAPRAGEADVEARAGRSRHGDRPVSADRGPLQAHAALTRSAAGRTDASGARDEGTDGGARCRPPRRARAPRPLHRAHQRADGRRGRVGRARAGHGASAAAPARRPRAAKGWRQRRCADGADRPGLHHRAPPPRSDDPGGRRTRCGVHGRERALPEGRHEGPLHGIPAKGVPTPR